MLIVSCRCVHVACYTCILKTDQMCDLSMQTFEVHDSCTCSLHIMWLIGHILYRCLRSEVKLFWGWADIILPVYIMVVNTIYLLETFTCIWLCMYTCVCVEVASSIKENRQTSTVCTVRCNFVDWVSLVLCFINWQVVLANAPITVWHWSLA